MKTAAETFSPAHVTLRPCDDADMARRRGQRKGWLRPEKGSWLLTYRLYDQFGRAKREVVTVGPAEGVGKLTKKQAERFAWDHYLSKVDQVALRPKSMMTVAEFWKETFEPSMRLRLKRSAQEQYASLYRVWIEPRLGKLNLAVVSPDHVEKIIGEVMAAGRSTSTSRHVRKVISAVLNRARRSQLLIGENPASLVDLPASKPVRRAFALTSEQFAAVMAALPEPYRTMALMALLTSMNIAEIAGLRWGCVNLRDAPVDIDGDLVAERHLAVRWHYVRGEYTSLKTESRKRDIPIAGALYDALAGIRAAGKFVGAADPVFASRSGRPVCGNNVQKRFLTPIGERLGLPRLGWHTFRHTHASLMKQLNVGDRDRMALMGHGSLEMLYRYTHEERAAMAVAVERLAQQIGAAKPTELKVIEMKKRSA
jgi:integrase